jgi:hypothetical protein
LTDKQAVVYEGLLAYGEAHLKDPHPTVRSLADFMEKRKHRSERFSDDEIRGLLETLIDKGYGGKYRNKFDQVRYHPVSSQAGETG